MSAKKKKESGKSSKKKPSTKKETQTANVRKKNKKQAEIFVRYRGKNLNADLSRLVKEVWGKLIKKGCFYSYTDIVDRVLKHTYWNIFFKHNPAIVYPCDSRFEEIIKDYVIVDDDEYYMNTIKNEIERVVDKYSDRLRYFIKGIDGKVRRFRNLFEYMDYIDDMLSIFWEALRNDTDDETGSERFLFSIYVASERYTRVLYVDLTTFTTPTGVSSGLAKEIDILYDEWLQYNPHRR